MKKVVTSPGNSQDKSKSRKTNKSDKRVSAEQPASGKKQVSAKPLDSKTRFARKLVARSSILIDKLPDTLPACDAPMPALPPESEAANDGPLERYFGMDVGSTNELCEVKDQRVVARAKITEHQQLQEWFGPGLPRARVVLEACLEAWYLWELLTNWGHEVWVVDTTRVRQLGIGDHGRKNDRIDAEKLAQAGEQGRVPRAWILSHTSQKLRYLLQNRRLLVETRARFVIAIRATLRSRGHRIRGCAAEDLWRKLKTMQLPRQERELIEPLVAILEALDPQIERADKQLDDYCKPSPIISLLSSVPGVGRIVAAVFMSVIDKPGRFKTAHQVQAYLGLVPSENTSGKRKLGSITKHGNAYARSMLVQAAWGILRQRRSDPLKAWGSALARRKGSKVAAVALARRLAGILWAMWRDGTAYDRQCVGQPSARAKRKEARETQQTAARIEASAAGAGR